MGKLLHPSRLNNMKLFVAALATIALAEEAVVEPSTEEVAEQGDCPLGWVVGFDTDECSPSGVSVTCDATQMTVTFPIDAVYFHGSTELNADQLLAAKADILAQSEEDCVDFSYNVETEEFTVMHSLVGCGTVATHDSENGNLVFTNSYTGDEAALTVDGILTTKVLSFQAECTYADSAVVSIDDVTISMGSNIAETVSGAGTYSFTMSTYDVDGVALSEDNKAEIGDQVTLKITPDAESTLPSNVEFHLVDCVAAEGFDEDGEATGAFYNILEEGSCVSNLLEAQFDGDATSNTEVNLDFNSFTFAAEEDQIDIKCNLKLCLVDDDDCFTDVQRDVEGFACDEKYSRSAWFQALPEDAADEPAADEPAADDTADVPTDE